MSSERPMIPTDLMTAAAPLAFRATGHDRSGAALGVLIDRAGARQHLAVGRDGAWTLSATLAVGSETVLLYESAANVLRGGELCADGSIAYQGSSYQLVSSFDGKAWSARVSAC